MVRRSYPQPRGGKRLKKDGANPKKKKKLSGIQERLRCAAGVRYSRKQQIARLSRRARAPARTRRRDWIRLAEGESGRLSCSHTDKQDTGTGREAGTLPN